MTKSVLTFLFILSTTFLFAQSEAQKKLEKRKEQLLEEIRVNERILQENKKKEKSVVNVIQQQKAKIELREKLNQTNEKQAKFLNDYINTNQ